MLRFLKKESQIAKKNFKKCDFLLTRITFDAMRSYDLFKQATNTNKTTKPVLEVPFCALIKPDPS